MSLGFMNTIQKCCFIVKLGTVLGTRDECTNSLHLLFLPDFILVANLNNFVA